ncbi:hypothetical protein GCM10010358_30800 [Streptomyces minutiscleroticus]|uniref:Carbon monoxide dehydrogenase subunit G n=1 Tax=Streptomyces minutiscleroticus TaxID=68238 RepID=A0A918NJ59_9ACTN|nr:hypothetical protein GCM10010358_30800 [Streptomyces minutiscleroticus]
MFVPVPAERLREALGDPVRVARAVPGLQQEAGADPGSGRLKIRVAGHSITYRGALRVIGRDDGTYAVVGDAAEVRGSGSVRLALTVRLTPEGTGTKVAFTGTATADGRVTDLPPDAVASAATRLLDRFAQNLGAGEPSASSASSVPDADRGGAGAGAASGGDTSRGAAEEGSAGKSPAGAGRTGGGSAGEDAAGGTGPAAAGDEGAAGGGDDTAGDKGSAGGGDGTAGGQAGKGSPTAGAQAGGADRAESGGADGVAGGGADGPEDSDADEPLGSGADEPAGGYADEAAGGGLEGGSGGVFEAEASPSSPDAFDGADFEGGFEEDAEPPAEAAHARRTMIGRSAEEVDHAPPRGRYAPVPVPEDASSGAVLRWAAPAAALVLASAVVVGRALRKRR